jgi:hypothetical protein
VQQNDSFCTCLCSSPMKGTIKCNITHQAKWHCNFTKVQWVLANNTCYSLSSVTTTAVNDCFLMLFVLIYFFVFCTAQQWLQSNDSWSHLAGIISRLKNTVAWFFMREKYYSGWKNKLNKTDYKPDEQGLYSTISLVQHAHTTLQSHITRPLLFIHVTTTYWEFNSFVHDYKQHTQQNK